MSFLAFLRQLKLLFTDKRILDETYESFLLANQYSFRTEVEKTGGDLGNGELL